MGHICDHLMYCDHIERDGEGLFQRACENDGEGVVAKRNCDPYLRARRVGLKCGIRTTHNGRDAKKFSIVSEKVILISHCERAASERVPIWPIEHHRVRLIEAL